MQDNDINDNKPKKRGRKPKNKVLEAIPEKIEIKSEEEPLIAHLGINMNEIVNNDTEEIESSTMEDYTNINISESDSIFIKAESVENETESEVNEIEKEILKLKIKLQKINKNNKIEVTKSCFDKNTKCWWCKNSFNTTAVQLPELYFEDKFYCTGNFCSYNCALSYNIDTNDNVWKRSSLLNLLYYKTYDEPKSIIASPDWKLLKEYGGYLTIEEFRKNSIINNEDYTLLHPPLETRSNTFEKTKNIIKTVSSNSIYQKFLDDSEELVLKRTNPLKSSQYSLDKTVLIKKKEKPLKMNKTTTQKLIFA
jgi:hypothetical protein